VNGTVSGTGSGGMSDVVCGAVYENKGIKKSQHLEVNPV
jgi:hypothetical protein